MTIALNGVSFQLPNTPIQFNNLSLSFDGLRYGLVGRNGIGKTTLLRLLAGQLTPDNGSIQHNSSVAYCPQNHNEIAAEASVVGALGLSPVLRALERIEAGGADEADFDCVANQWDIHDKIQITFKKIGLSSINLDHPFHQLSGGQKTKALLASVMLQPADILLLDEPTNNLDKTSREKLYAFIENTRKGVILVSHDRKLLNHCDRILELSSLGLKQYGGNYDFYQTEKTTQEQAALQSLKNKEQNLKQSQKTAQTRLEKHQKSAARGVKEKRRQINQTGSYDKLALKSKQGRSEKTNQKIRIQANRKLKTVSAELAHTQLAIDKHKELSIQLNQTQVAKQKIILEIQDLCFSYDEKTVIDDFSLTITGPERVALSGPNGCGKSTLIQLIRQQLTPRSGTITLVAPSVAYLDQNGGFKDTSLNLVDAFSLAHPEAELFDAHLALAAFGFRNTDAKKQILELSGGERIRASLAIQLSSDPVPQLMILDEPTNHLDLEAIASLENALQAYQGAMLVVSHDSSFLDNIAITRHIYLQSPLDSNAT